MVGFQLDRGRDNEGVRETQAGMAGAQRRSPTGDPTVGVRDRDGHRVERGVDSCHGSRSTSASCIWRVVTVTPHEYVPAE